MQRSWKFPKNNPPFCFITFQYFAITVKQKEGKQFSGDLLILMPVLFHESGTLMVIN